MDKLTSRKKQILEAVIREYVVNASPVGSRTIARRYDIDISPATIRNEMADLEELGYLAQPHTSAGRIPSDKGYRFYVDNLMQKSSLTGEEQIYIRQAFRERNRSIREILAQTSELLSLVTDYTSLILRPSIKKTVFHRIEMLPMDSRNILVIIITDTGFVETDVIRTTEEISREELNSISRLVNERLYGLTLEEIGPDLFENIERELIAKNNFIMETIDFIKKILLVSDEEDIRLGGTSNILEQPEFKDIGKLKKLLVVLEKESILSDLLSRAFTSSGVFISIGTENDYEEIKECSLITARYQIGDHNIGSIGVLGPTRMEYARVISAVDFVARCLSEVLTELNS